MKAVPSLTAEDAALVREAFHLQEQLGQCIWPEWKSNNAPFLYKTQTHEFLLNHPHPPEEFSQTGVTAWEDTLWTRVNTDTMEYQAAFPINGTNTAVMSAPRPNDDPCGWTLKAVHELFHLFQGTERVINPFVGPYATEHELSFPFAYQDQVVSAACRLEGELLFGLVTRDHLDESDILVSKRVLKDLWKVQNAVIADSLHMRYKRWMEWNEGVARYTERQLAYLARDHSLYHPTPYHPTPAFLTFFPDNSYDDVWETGYANMLQPIRFVGEGVQQRQMFYYLGMGKAYLLDCFLPDWKGQYRRKGLDELLVQE